MEPDTRKVSVIASADRNSYRMQLDSPLKEGDYLDIGARRYYVCGRPVLVLKSTHPSGLLGLDYQTVNLELRN